MAGAAVLGQLTYRNHHMESSSQHLPSIANAHRTAAATLPFMQHPSAARSLTAREARLARVLSDDRLHALLVVSFGTEAWSVSPPAPFEAATPGVLELQIADQTTVFAMDLSNWPALASAALDPDANPADAELRRAIASVLLEPLFQILASLGFEGIRSSAVHRGRPEPDAALPTVSFRLAERDIRLGIVHAADGWLDLLEQLVADQCVPFPACISRLPVPGRIEIGSRALNVAALQSLRPGDIVMRAVQHPANAIFDAAPTPICAPIAWGSHGMRQLRCTAHIDSTTLTLTGAVRMSLATSNDSLSPAEPQETLVSVGELDLPVKIEIDTVSMPVAQLSALRAGYVLELPTLVRDAQVRLTSYGQTLAHGELVAVGEHVGVRILRMCNQSVPA
jgi:type III secretion protein Q